MPSERIVIVDRERRMVGEATPLVDRLAQCSSSDAWSGHLVIDTPADVLRVGLPAIGPPGVMARLRVQAPEHIDETDLVEDVAEPRALFGGEARILLVRAPVGKVDLPMRDVPVAAQDDFL